VTHLLYVRYDMHELFQDTFMNRTTYILTSVFCTSFSSNHHFLLAVHLHGKEVDKSELFGKYTIITYPCCHNILYTSVVPLMSAPEVSSFVFPSVPRFPETKSKENRH
jgi:hypothetical protein